MNANPYESPTSEAASRPPARPSGRWCSAAWLICCVGCLIVKYYALSYASQAMITVAQRKDVPVQAVVTADRLAIFALGLLIPAALLGILSAFTDRGVLQAVAALAFVLTLAFSLVIV